ncbi:MAG TPA: hypothetical protein VFV33_06705, partial [Gemmatimonadaceae bacterium]|nr:hypothetical protein [Gemmatimonadaceae bacterium]
SELERENVLVTWRATRTLTLSAGRQHFRHDSAFQGLPQRATLNQVAANASLLGTTLSAGVFASQAGGLRNLSASFSARRDLTARLQSEFYLLQVLRPAAARLTTPVLLLRETISPRLSLLQVITRDRGRTSVSFGGTVTTGLTSVSLDYQVAHSPFLTRNPFVQTIGINARLQLGSYGLSVGSFVTPDGKVHYSAQGSTFLYRGMGRVAGPLAGTPGGRVDRYVLNGRVVDEAGAAVEGAAVEVGGEVVYTDSRGRFFVRRPGASPLALRVVLDDFLVPGTFEVVQAPRAVTPTRDERLAPVTIVVRRLPPRR